MQSCRLTKVVLHATAPDSAATPAQSFDTQGSERHTLYEDAYKEKPLRMLVVSSPEMSIERQAMLKVAHSWNAKHGGYPITVRAIQLQADEAIPARVIRECDFIVSLFPKRIASPTAPIFAQLCAIPKRSRLYLLRETAVAGSADGESERALEKRLRRTQLALTFFSERGRKERQFAHEIFFQVCARWGDRLAALSYANVGIEGFRAEYQANGD